MNGKQPLERCKRNRNRNDRSLGGGDMHFGEQFNSLVLGIYFYRFLRKKFMNQMDGKADTGPCIVFLEFFSSFR